MLIDIAIDFCFLREIISEHIIIINSVFFAAHILQHLYTHTKQKQYKKEEEHSAIFNQLN